MVDFTMLLFFYILQISRLNLQIEDELQKNGEITEKLISIKKKVGIDKYLIIRHLHFFYVS